MTREEIIQAISDDKMMPFIQPEQLAQIVEFVIKNYRPSLPSNLDEAAEEHVQTLCDRADDNLRIDTTLQAAFKAGAEWMAGQDEVLTTETVDELCYDCHDRVPKLIEKTGLSADDRVELIVRKI